MKMCYLVLKNTLIKMASAKYLAIIRQVPGLTEINLNKSFRKHICIVESGT